MGSKMKRQRLVFSEKLMYSFIHDYKENACLWDIKHPDYKCAEKRKAAFARLASRYDITEEEAKKKLNSLRSTYLQEKKKVEESKRNGGEIYEPSLYWFQELDFLYDVIIPRHRTSQSAQTYNCPTASPQPPSPSPEQVTHLEQDTETNQEEVDQEHLIFEFVPEGNEKTLFTQKLEPAAYNAVRRRPIRPGIRTLNRRPQINPPLPVHKQQFSDHVDVEPQRPQSQERTHQLPPMPILLQDQVPDEFDKFCTSIASQLRTLPPADAIEMQLEIQQLVSRRRLVVLKNQRHISLQRSWENADGFHHTYSLPHTQSSGMDNDSGQEEKNDSLILEQ